MNEKYENHCTNLEIDTCFLFGETHILHCFILKIFGLIGIGGSYGAVTIWGQLVWGLWFPITTAAPRRNEQHTNIEMNIYFICDVLMHDFLLVSYYSLEYSRFDQEWIQMEKTLARLCLNNPTSNAFIVGVATALLLLSLVQTGDLLMYNFKTIILYGLHILFIPHPQAERQLHLIKHSRWLSRLFLSIRFSHE